ncbi:MAG: RagB/SusD family nutrient uptake outer membrane protein [Cyclobacteriaceae bacterium]|nr:RagB/SusD family nutrient uptake outer membrane protein [Cyclobacteriaceae bacterium]
MKTKYTFIFILGLFVGLQSCKDFLELEPQTYGTPITNTEADSVFYKTAGEVEAALAGVYADFKNEYFELDYFVNGDAQSDDAYAGADNPDNFQIDDYKIIATNGNVSRDWEYLYTTIGKANRVINNVLDVTDSDLTDARKKEIIGEASFIRAFCYFQIVQLWGDAPLQLEDLKSLSPETLPELYMQVYPEKSTADEIYNQIILDFETALENVNVTADNKEIVTKGAANAMLAKVYATIVPHDWSKVNAYCEAVIGGGYSLLPEYDQLWDNEHENSSESIFEINYYGGSVDHNWGTQMFRGLDWKKFNTPSNDLVKAFDDEGDDIRKDASIIFLDVTGLWTDSHWPQTNFPFINKYRNFVSPSDQNYIFLRLADIMLLNAEALNELGNLSGAADMVNQIRARVGLSNTTASTSDAMALAIEKERRLELAFEGHRWYDLKRTGRAIEVINSAIDENGDLVGYNLTEDRQLWPIPQAELDKNANLTQNPGY